VEARIHLFIAHVVTLTAGQTRFVIDAPDFGNGAVQVNWFVTRGLVRQHGVVSRWSRDADPSAVVLRAAPMVGDPPGFMLRSVVSAGAANMMLVRYGVRCAHLTSALDQGRRQS
jgi:hypothetical protein